MCIYLPLWPLTRGWKRKKDERPEKKFALHVDSITTPWADFAVINARLVSIMTAIFVRRHFLITFNGPRVCAGLYLFVRVDLNPLDKKLTRSLVRSVRIDFWTIFLIWYNIPLWFVYSYLLRLCNFCKAPRDMRNFPQKRQKIAGCEKCAVYASRPPIASTDQFAAMFKSKAEGAGVPISDVVEDILMFSLSVKKTTSQNVWPRINSNWFINELIQKTARRFVIWHFLNYCLVQIMSLW